jgi:hypothetical protein
MKTTYWNMSITMMAENEADMLWLNNYAKGIYEEGGKYMNNFFSIRTGDIDYDGTIDLKSYHLLEDIVEDFGDDMGVVEICIYSYSQMGREYCEEALKDSLRGYK